MARYALTLCALLSVAACDARFAADFEGEQVGAPPPASPLGPPSGDQILLSTTNVSGNGTAITVTDNPDVVPGSGAHRFLSLDRVASPGASTSVQLRSSEFATSTQPLFLISDQVLVGLGPAEIQFYEYGANQSEVSYCRVITGNDSVTLRCSANLDARAESASITDFDSQSPHRIVVRIDRPAGPVRMSVSQEGISENGVTVAPAGLVFPGEGERLNLPVLVDGAVGNAYRLNSVSLSERDPG